MNERPTPMYLKIMEDLRTIIEAGAFDYDVPLCTEKSVKEKYNVSRITAKRALDELESEGLLFRKRGVGSFVKKTDDSNSKYAIPEPTVISKSVALMIPFSFTRGGIFTAIQSASNILAFSGIYLTLHVYSPGLNNEAKMLDELYANQVDAVIYYPTTTKLPVTILDRYCEDKKPVIIIDKPHNYPQYSNIVCDNFQGSYMLTSHVLAYGHRNTCYLSRYGCEEVNSISDRYDGYMKSLEDNGVNTPRFEKITIPENAPFDYPMLKHVINTLYNDDITAIICENDEVAFYVHMCTRSLSLRPPEDLSITGFDNIEWATTGSAQITTAKQDFSSIGEAIAEIILQLEYEPVHKVLPVSLVFRTSTGPVPARDSRK
jgi:Transcriptional regulators